MRRKLLIEKYIDKDFLDGDVWLGAPSGITPEMVAAERFVVNPEDLKVLMDNPPAARQLLKEFPYHNMWFEFGYLGGGGTEFAAHVTRSLVTVFGPVGRGRGLVRYGHAELGDVLSPTGTMVAEISKALYDHTIRNNGPVDELPTVLTFVVRNALLATAILNTKGDVVRESPPVDKKLNVARAKKGKPPLRNYTYIYLDQTERGGGTATGASGGKATHLVRGHFKRRSTGVFWWRPHLAGTLPEKRRDAYVVKSKGEQHAQIK